MLNKQNELPHLEEYCKEMFEAHKVRFQPHNPPVDLILDELMGKIKSLTRMTSALAYLVEVIYAEKQQAEEVAADVEPKKTKRKRR